MANAHNVAGQYSASMAEDDGSRIRKRLVSEDGSLNVRGQPVPNLLGKVSNAVLLLENGATSGGEESAELGSNTPGKLPIVKKRKQGEEGSEVDTDMNLLAVSISEDCWSQ